MPVWSWGQPIDGIIQTAFIVDDIEAAMPLYARELKIGPWFLIERFEIVGARHRGQPADIDITLALGNNGHMMFELIQQNNDTPSVYREVQETRGFGFHHFAVAAAPESFDQVVADYASRGYDVTFEGATPIGGRLTYVDSRADLPGMIEVIEVTPKVERLFLDVFQAHRAWGGEGELVRRV